MECHHCHTPLTCTSSYNHQKKIYLYYRCPKCKKLISEQIISRDIKPLLKDIIKVDNRALIDEEKKLNKELRKLKKLEKVILNKLANEEISTDEYLAIYNKTQASLHSLERKLQHNKDTLAHLKEEIFYKQNDLDQFLIIHKNNKKIEVDLIEKKILVIEYLIKK